jgi:hypothetical protein
MFTRMIVTGLVILSLSARLPVYSAGRAMAQQAPQDSRIEGVKSQIKELGMGDAVTVSLIKGKTVRGFLTRVGDSEFEIATAARDSYFTFKYRDVERVDRGFDPGFKKIQTADDQVVQAPLSPDARADAMKLRIASLGIDEYARVTHKNGKKFYGLLTRIGDDDFELTDYKRQVTFTIRYLDLKKVEGGRKGGNWLLPTIIAVTVGPMIAALLMTKRGRGPEFPSPPF